MMMFRILAVTISMLACGAAADAQDLTAAPSIPLRVELVISRYQGDRKVSSVPFTFFVNATNFATLSQAEPSRVRMGIELPIVNSPSSPEAKESAATGKLSPVQYRAFGTNIDCIARILENGQFKMSLTVEESAPYSEQDKARLTASTNEPRALSANPVFRSFRVSNVLVLKDGQSQQFSSATDRFSGEVVKMDVTVSVIK